MHLPSFNICKIFPSLWNYEKLPYKIPNLKLSTFFMHLLSKPPYNLFCFFPFGHGWTWKGFHSRYSFSPLGCIVCHMIYKIFFYKKKQWKIKKDKRKFLPTWPPLSLSFVFLTPSYAFRPSSSPFLFVISINVHLQPLNWAYSPCNKTVHCNTQTSKMRTRKTEPSMKDIDLGVEMVKTKLNGELLY